MNECCSMWILGTAIKSKKETVEEDVAGCWNALWAEAHLWAVYVCVCWVLSSVCSLYRAVPWHGTLCPCAQAEHACFGNHTNALYKWKAHVNQHDVNQHDVTRMNFPRWRLFLQVNLEFSSYSAAFFSSSVILLCNVFISLCVVQQSAK